MPDTAEVARNLEKVRGAVARAADCPQAGACASARRSKCSAIIPGEWRRAIQLPIRRSGAAPSGESRGARRWRHGVPVSVLGGVQTNRAVRQSKQEGPVAIAVDQPRRQS